MNTDSQGSLSRPDAAEKVAREIRTCPTCGARFSATAEHESCPVCLLREAREKTVEPAPVHATQRFEHYEVTLGEDGRPLELGRGAMGITYKAVDVDLHCPVTLKVISEQYLGDEAARVRFLREARAAASVRHPNVASVFHLGRKGSAYCYAMEFVEGETLDSLIRRSGRLEVKLALEITRQVASGLAAVHKKNLVHRDIKPSIIMVSFEEEGAVAAKIIDLGLAKVQDESGGQTTISASGAFAGTPEFASPEQIVGGEVDIRSDLYSLGISLWQMLIGAVPFRGSAAVVMAQHQHAAVNVLDAREAVLAALVHFFEDGRWEAPIQTGAGDHRLCPGDQLFILMQAAVYLAATRSATASEARICNERAESLCRSLNRPQMLHVALIGQWRHWFVSFNLRKAMQIATRVHSLAQEQQHNPALSMKAHMALAVTHYYLGNFTHAREEATSGVRLWYSGVEKSELEELDEPIIGCLCHKAFCAWHAGQIASGRSTMGEAIFVAKRLKNTHGIAVALFHSATLCHMEQNLAQAERVSSELNELSTRQHFPQFCAVATALLGWARGVRGLFTQSISWIEDGIEELQTKGALFPIVSLMAPKAEILYLANRTSEALATIREAETLVEKTQARWWSAEFCRLRAIFLTAIDFDEAEIERAFQDAINTAKQQKSTSLRKRAESTYAEYCRQKASAAPGHGFRLPLI